MPKYRVVTERGAFIINAASAAHARRQISGQGFTVRVVREMRHTPPPRPKE